jgi:ribosomal protein S21
VTGDKADREPIACESDPMTVSSEHAALRSASSLAIADASLARLERDRPGHGGAELARRVKDACPDASKVACRRAADRVLEVRLGRSRHVGLTGDGRSVERRLTPSRALGRTPNAVPPPLADRLAAHKRARLIHSFDDCGFRHSRAWGDAGRYEVRVGAPAASQATEEGWIDYRSRGYKRGIVGESVRLTVPADWGTRVRLSGLAVLDGMLTLDAEQLPTSGNVEVYRAVWARQGRGVSLVTERGYIARHVPSGTTYHSTDSDPEKALRGLKRKVTAQGIPAAVREGRRGERAAQRAIRQAASLVRLVERLARWDLAEIEHVEVTRSDSIRAGNCVPGTDAFIDRYGFDGRTSATIGEIANAVGRRDVTSLSDADLTLARQLAAACLYAVRRDKQVRRLVLS